MSLGGKLLQDSYLAIDYREHLKDVGNEPIVFAEQEHVESGGEVAGDTCHASAAGELALGDQFIAKFGK